MAKQAALIRKLVFIRGFEQDQISLVPKAPIWLFVNNVL